MNKGMVQVDQERLRAQLEKKLPPKVRLFQLDDIPGVMRSRMGWPVAAALMERWFRGAGYEMPEYMKQGRAPYKATTLGSMQLEEGVVTMGWALGFARVRAALAKLQVSWATPAGIRQLQKRADDWIGIRSPQGWRLGNLAQAAKMLDETCQVNFLTFGRMSDPLDDLYGAMGEATLKVAVSGWVTRQGTGRTAVAIDELGFYLRDSYDFSDGDRAFLSQPLGFWGYDGVSRVNPPGGQVLISEQWSHESEGKARGHTYLVQNEDFRKWRAKHGRGGDFIVLSDVHRVRLPFPMKLEW
ncbi:MULTISPECIES: DUF6402 family protein [unclassified Acidovorax]|uniref:DUF6402 family protein n=1 Tax=unclassified Acidovorax TaxID=2684926 RepID=UPI0023DE69DB|nr:MULTISPECIES: DUF6402 family protein [unclassified Acidovorax]GKS89424.1 DUF6402 family protein [Acidovorax sp. SUPP2539]GKS95992.1 DUF6402 family protein [Acidovorax sp. SUPP2825]